MLNRKILIAIAFICVSAGLAFALYFVFFRQPVRVPPPQTQPRSEGTAPLGSLSPAQPGSPRVPAPLAPSAPTEPSAQSNPTSVPVTTITNVPAFAPVRSPDGSGVHFYNPATGQFMRVDANGSMTPLSDKIFYNVSQTTWSPKDTKAIIEYPDGAKTLYNFDTKQQVTLPSHWQSFTFSPDGSQVAFLSMGAEAGNRWLAVAKDNGSNARAIEPLGDNAAKVIVSWSPNDNVIAFSKTPATPGAFNDQEILLVGKNNENFKSLKVAGINFIPTWSPDGALLLYSVTDSTNDLRPRLWVTRGTTDTIGQNKTPLPISTWADKCAFATTTVAYCAVPTELPEGAGLLRDVAKTVPDTIYRVDIANGATTLVATPETPQTISQIIPSSDGKTLYIRNQDTGQLNAITLR